MFFPFTNPKNRYERLLDAHFNYVEALKAEEDFEKYYKKYPTDKNEKHFSKLSAKTKELGEKKYVLEQAMVNPKLGLYLGLAVNLKELKEIEPLYANWGNVSNNMGYQGTTRQGKTRALMSLSDQIILKGDDIIEWDPKQGGNEVLMSAIESAYKAGRMKDLAFFSPMYPELTQFINPIYPMKDEEITSMLLSFQHPNPLPSGNEIFYKGFMSKSLMGTLRGLTYLEKALDPEGHGLKLRLKTEVTNYYKMTAMRGLNVKGYDTVNNILYPDPIDRIYEGDLKAEEVHPESMLFNRTFITFRELFYYSDFSRLEDILNSVKTTPVPVGINPALREEIGRIRTDAILLLEGIITKGKDYYEAVSEGYRSLLGNLATGRIGQAFCTVRVNPLRERLQSDKGIIAVINPCPLKFQNTAELITKIYQKMLESIFGTLAVKGRSSIKRLWFIIDEGESVLSPGIQASFNKLSGIGMTSVLAMQSDADADYKLGKDLARIVRDNINTWVILKANDPESQKNVVKLLGSVRVFKSTFMSEAGGAGGRSTVQSDLEDLILTSNIDELLRGEAYVKHMGQCYKVILPYVKEPGGGKYILKMPDIEEDYLDALEKNIQSSINICVDRANQMKDEAEHARAV